MLRGVVSSSTMWKEYTREAPARSGWTLGGMVLIFAGTLVLADWTAGSRRFSHHQVLAGWPITFKLPDEYRWRRADDVLHISLPKVEYTAMYLAYHRDQGHFWLSVRCDPTGEAVSPSEKLGRGLRAIIGIEESIRIGPLNGSLSRLQDEDGGAKFYAEAASDDGLRIDIVLVAESARLQTVKKMIRQICESVEIVPRESRPAAPK